MSSSVDSAGAELRIICGPTGAGKSAVAMRLAERYALEIVSADSRQIYRRFDIGTAKPSAADRARVPHSGIDVADPAERWSAARWAEDSRRRLAEIRTDGALVVGGTGLYLRALVAPLFAGPALDPHRSRALDLELGAMPIDELRRWVGVLDPPRAHLGRTQLQRAAQVALLSGTRLSDLHRTSARPRAFRARWLIVDPGEGLAVQITARVDGMFAAGWADEVRMLDAEIDADAPAWQSCGYRSVRSLVRGTIDAREARETIIIATRQYAKRQRTWFRHQLAHGGDSITAVNPHEPGCDALVDHWWSSGDPA